MGKSALEARIRSWRKRRRSKASSITSSSARAPPAACSPTGCRHPGQSVLLLEAGGRDNWIWLHIPVGYLFAMGNPRADWMFRTEPEPGLNGRTSDLSARPGDRRLVGHQRHDLHAGTGRRLRSLAPARPAGLGVGRRPAVLPEESIISGREPARARRRMARRKPRLRWEMLDVFREAAAEYGIPPTTISTAATTRAPAISR